MALVGPKTASYLRFTSITHVPWPWPIINADDAHHQYH